MWKRNSYSHVEIRVVEILLIELLRDVRLWTYAVLTLYFMGELLFNFGELGDYDELLDLAFGEAPVAAYGTMFFSACIILTSLLYISFSIKL